MAGVAAKNRRKRILRFAFGGALLLLAGIGVLGGSAWYLNLIVAVIAGIAIVGQRRILRAGISRSGDEVVCRYLPWYEGNAYSALVLIPLMGVAMVGAGCAPGNPVWLRFGGILLLVLTPIFVFSAVLMWRRSLLRITASTVTVRLVERGSELTEIRREQVESIEPRIVPVPVNAESLQVAITYRPIDVGVDTTKTVIIGLRLTVRPVALFNALTAWKDGAEDDPGELLDRVERLLRGRSMADV